ncbi:MAG TPA: CrcB family protein [Candidatus Hydrogenedentes bacterium]|nr:CrcB family protein [Candidatus Hydrogenedentota bacterium]HPG69782.1 CrcB family protein [Candidatus Hydrogenedentota bacterium]
MFPKVVYLALAGAAGTFSRYALSTLVQRAAGGAFPWGTLAVNVLGCFLVGLFWTLTEHRFTVSNETRTIVLIGFMGAFTTFSAFVYETGQLFRDVGWFHAAGNMVLQNLIGVAALFTGVCAGRVL